MVHFHLFSPFPPMRKRKEEKKGKTINRPIQVHLSPSKQNKTEIIMIFFFFLSKLQIKSSFEWEYRLFNEAFPSPDWLLFSLVSGITQNASCCRKTMARRSRSHVVKVCPRPRPRADAVCSTVVYFVYFNGFASEETTNPSAPRETFQTFLKLESCFLFFLISADFILIQ